MLSLPVSMLRLLGRMLLVAAVSPWLTAAAAETVRVGTADWLPYVDQQREDGGALARLVREIFTAAGYQVELVYYPWERNLLMLEQGQLDAVMPYVCSAERQRISVCSDPVVQAEVVLFQRRDRVLNWNTVKDLKAFRFATTLGYFYGPQFDAALKAGQLQVQQHRKSATGFRLVQLGRVDFYPQDRAAGYAKLRQIFSKQERDTITHHPRPLNRVALHLLFRQGDAQADQLREVFNAGLRRLAASGSLARLQQALSSGDADQWRPVP